MEAALSPVSNGVRGSDPVASATAPNARFESVGKAASHVPAGSSLVQEAQ